jgi:hypothetical protein
MDSKTISIRPRKRQGGFSVLEFIIASCISVLTLGVVTAFTFYSSRSFAAMTNYAEMNDASRQALDQMTREIRQSLSLRSFATNSVTFNAAGGGLLTYTYSPDSRTLVRQKGDESQVLLADCDSAEFSMSKRNPVAGGYEQYPAATPAECKLISITWVCSKKILGKKVNTEMVQTAKIVLRNQ